MYEILPYSFSQAKKLNVQIHPSLNKKYKIDVFSPDGYYITSIGASGYSDYPHYIEEKGQQYADNRRRLYKLRHNKDRTKLYSRGYYSDNILW